MSGRANFPMSRDLSMPEMMPAPNVPYFLKKRGAREFPVVYIPFLTESFYALTEYRFDDAGWNSL
jgi:hypothetical protein